MPFIFKSRMIPTREKVNESQEQFNSVYCRGFSIDTLSNSGTARKNTTIDEKRQQAVLLTVTCALTATKLIVVFSPDFVEQHIATISLHLIGLLRSGLYLIRDQACDCLSKCMTILGKRYFKFILRVFVDDFFNAEKTELWKASEQ